MILSNATIIRKACNDFAKGDISAVLDPPVMVVATIALHGEGIIDSIEHRADVHLYQMTRKNREGLVEEIARAVRSYFTTVLCGGRR